MPPPPAPARPDGTVDAPRGRVVAAEIAPNPRRVAHRRARVGRRGRRCGTGVALFTLRRTAEPTHATPTLLTGYCGFAVTMSPTYCPAPVAVAARLWTPEYGDPEVADELAWPWAYSPCHHLVEGTCYPATPVLAGEHDSRVDPAHARKFGAALAWATSCGVEGPVLVRVESRAGHGQGKPASKQVDEAAGVHTFLRWQIGLGT